MNQDSSISTVNNYRQWQWQEDIKRHL